MYRDPSGKIFPVLAAIVIGALIGGAISYSSGGNVLEGMIIGAVAGAAGWGAGASLGLAAGGGVSGAAAGVIGGAVAGGLAGAATGGAINVLMGHSFAEGATRGGIIGMVAGAVTGGIAGYSNPYFANSFQSSGMFDFLDGCIGGAAVASAGLTVAAAGFALIPVTGGTSIVIGWWATGAIGGGALIGAGAKGVAACI